MIFDKLKNLRSKVSDKLDKSNDVNALRKLRNECDKMSSEIQNKIDELILKENKIPDLRNSYIHYINDEQHYYVHVSSDKKSVSRLIKGVKLNIDVKYTFISENEFILDTDNNNDIMFDYEDIKHINIISKDEFLDIIINAINKNLLNKLK